MKQRHLLYTTPFLLIALFMTITPQLVSAQDSINYDETKVPPYSLPDPLQLPNGKHITTTEQWMQQQRPAMLKLFADNVYGRMPGKPQHMHFVVNSLDSSSLNGKAIRKQITIFFTQQPSSPSMELLLYLPRSVKGPVPVFTGLNFSGNQSVSRDTGIHLSTRWIENDSKIGIVNNQATEASRASEASRWPVEEIIGRGYGLATAYYGDLEPDYPGDWKTGIRTTLQSELNINADEWGAIGAWAWGLSRIIDYLETDPSVNPKQVVITGHSRLCKAALWCAANDTRFAIIVSNNSGEGGAALSKRWYGETIARINTSFPHWFCSKYKEYNGKANLLPVDQ